MWSKIWKIEHGERKIKKVRRKYGKNIFHINNQNRKIYLYIFFVNSMNKKTSRLAFGILGLFLCCQLMSLASGQSVINKIWLGVDNNLRANAPDENLRNLLKDARLRAVVPTSGGMIMLYSLADESEAQVTVKMTTTGQILGTKV